MMCFQPVTVTPLGACRSCPVMWIQANACVSHLLPDYAVKNALYVFASDSPFRGASLVAQMVEESACNSGGLGLIPGLGRSLGGGHGNPLQ